ncbi:MAG: general secretion pathway protein GspK [Desulfovibrionaceae bacterium]
MILVLVCLLGLMGIVLASQEQAFKQSYDARLLEAEMQADTEADAALLVVDDLLRHDLTGASDAVDEPWATPWRQGDLTITITPCNARLNLNQVLGGNRTRTAVEELLHDARRPVKGVLLLQDWIDDDREERVFGSEGKGFAHIGRAYQQRDRQLQTLEEVLLVDSWEDADPEWVREHFTVWSTDNRLNVNFVPENVFKAYLPELASEWLSLEHWREREGGLKNISELQLAIPVLASNVELYTATLPLVTVKSTTFRVIIEVDAPLVYVKRRYIVSREIDAETGGLTVVNRGALTIRPKDLF